MSNIDSWKGSSIGNVLGVGGSYRIGINVGGIITSVCIFRRSYSARFILEIKWDFHSLLYDFYKFLKK